MKTRTKIFGILFGVLLLSHAGLAHAISYATWNGSDKNAGITLSGGSLTAVGSGGGASWQGVRATISKATSSGTNWYFETAFTAQGTDHDTEVALITGTFSLSAPLDGVGAYMYEADGVVDCGGTQHTGQAHATAGSTVGILVNLTTNVIQFIVNGTPIAQTCTMSAGTYFPALGILDNADSITANFGATTQTSQPPSSGYCPAWSDTCRPYIQFDSAVTTNGDASSPYTLSFTNTNGNFCTASFDMTSTNVVSSVTYNSVAMAQLQKVLVPGANREMYQYTLNSCPTGTHNVVVTFTGADLIYSGASSYFSSPSNAVIDTSDTGTVTSAINMTDTQTPGANGTNGWHITVGESAQATLSAGTGATARGTIQANAFGFFDSNGNTMTSGVSNSVTMNQSSTFGGGWIGLILDPPTSGGGSTTQYTPSFFIF